MAAGSGGGQEVTRILIEAAAHAGEADRRRRENCSEPSEVDHDQPVLGQLAAPRRRRR